MAKYYEIQSGDSLRSIARKFDMTLSELQALNPKAGDNIYVGDKLLVQRPQPYLQVQTVRTIT
ncbi:MAG: LysM peptidoglycan-binding domain-containing protein [Clostridia bacterium]|nr:LysM peptidoglycan-binding domain-containing protein [Clostridia bacterium]